jgi:hypothetical protein
MLLKMWGRRVSALDLSGLAVGIHLTIQAHLALASPSLLTSFSSIPVLRALLNIMAWNFDLCLAFDRRVLVPFHCLVEPKFRLPQTGLLRSFPFARLPIDIQLIVYEHCDLPTLFQLMRTCSRTRGPAAKLFWANPSESHWYYSDDDGLFLYGRVVRPIIMHCPDFAQRITRIELNLVNIGRFFEPIEKDREFSMRNRVVSPAEKAQVFWKKVEKAFPAVKRIALAGRLPQRPLPPPPGEFDEKYDIIETVVRYAPPHIQVQIAFDDGAEYPRRYTLWQFNKSQTPMWQVIDPDWTRIHVLLPPRIFSPSPLGDLLTQHRLGCFLTPERAGLNWLRVETFARYAINGVILCPRPDCDASFTERSLWKHHLDDVGHWYKGTKHREKPIVEFCSRETPDDVVKLLEAREKRIDDHDERHISLRRQIGCAYGEVDSEQRRLFEQQFFADLEELNFATPGELCLWPDTNRQHWINYLNLCYMHSRD